MQLAIDAYLEASQEALQQSATDLEDQVALQTSALEERARQLETLYLVSAAASRELDLEKVLASTLPLIVDVVGAGGRRCCSWMTTAASRGQPAMAWQTVLWRAC
jgi:nitrate/nitrite-specific signal transduction histidine kinase